MKEYREPRGFIKFVKEQLGANPTKQQEKVMEDMQKERKITVKAGHGVGKTALAAWFLIWFIVTHPFARIPCTSNKEDQIKERLWPEVKKWVRGSPWDDYIIHNKTRIHIKGYPEDWFAKIETASDPDNLAGYHAKYLLYIVDEASGLGKEFAQVIQGAITTEGAKVFMIGNPTKRSGYFYDSHTKNVDKWANHTLSCRNSPLVSEEYIKDMEDEWGKDSDVVRVRVDGKFPKSESDSYISIELVEQAFEFELLEAIGPKVLGVDVARFGDDEIVFHGRQGRKDIERLTFTKKRTTNVTGRIIERIREVGYEKVNIDVGNMGAGVIDQLIEKVRELDLDVIVNEIGFGDSPPDEELKKHNKDMTAVMWRNFRDKLKEGIDLSHDEKVKEQLTNRKYEFDGSGRLKLESKKKMKARGLDSPDRADACVLAYYDGEGRSNPEDLETFGTSYAKEASVW
ncbi:hypothetical protein MWH25_08190 [Natroniella acetigena]|nr:hypothetical protein [Natroniella acetigena]